MRKRMTSFCLALILSITTVVLSAEPPSIPEQCSNNTVVVIGPASHGSGVLYTKGDTTFIWTAAHVIDKYMQPDGTFRDFLIVQDKSRARARVLRCSDYMVTHDIALLQVVRGNLKGGAQFYEAFDEVELGQEVIHCGTPFDPAVNSNLLFFGHISYIGRMFRLPILPIAREVDQCDLPTYSGCSGGPVFDAETGDILGIMVMGGKPGLSVMVPTRKIYEWAESHDCLWAFDSGVPLPKKIILWPGDRLERLQEEEVKSRLREILK